MLTQYFLLVHVNWAPFKPKEYVQTGIFSHKNKNKMKNAEQVENDK